MIETDQDRTLMLSDWGVAASLSLAGQLKKTVTGIFDAAFNEIDIGGGVGFATTSPRFLCKTSDIVGAADADTLTIASAVYKIRVIQPDGTGMSELMLEAQ